MKLLLFFLIGCASDTGAIYVSDKSSNTEEIDCNEAVLGLSCQQTSDELERLNDICVQSEDREACNEENCVTELAEKLQTQSCQDDCFWQPASTCQNCVAEQDQYGFESYMRVVFEACVCSHEYGSTQCSTECENEDYIGVYGQCNDNFISSGAYQDYFETCYISDFAQQCSQNVLCEEFFSKISQCSQN